MKKVFRNILACIQNVRNIEVEVYVPEPTSLPQVPTPQPAIPSVDRVIDNKWNLLKLIHSGQQSAIFMADDNNGRKVAVKIGQNIEIDHEITVYSTFHKVDKDWGLARMIDRGTHRGSSYFVMDLLGPTLEHFLSTVEQGQISKNFRLAILGQLLYRLETLHSLGFVHGNVEPGNILFARSDGSKETVYLIDFKHAYRYKEAGEDTRTTFENMKDVSFPVRFAPISYHDGYMPSRADDLESLIYIYVFMCKSRLPWDVFSDPKNDVTVDNVRQMKACITSSDLLSELENGVVEMLAYVRSLSRAERPDYHYLRKLVKKAILE